VAFFSVCSQLRFTKKRTSAPLFSGSSQLWRLGKFGVTYGHDVAGNLGGFEAGKTAS
jgi:hypothetical protein